ncbi:MAG: alpha-amylase family protein [Acidobacteriota bacterium]
MFRPSCPLALVVLSLTAVLPTPAEVILHAFDWKYNDIGQNAQAIADAGYRAVLVAPPLKSERSPGCPWYQLYQPQDFRVIDNCAGNKSEFVAMIQALTSKNVRVYADIVVNHMANERNNATTFPGSQTLTGYSTNSAFWNAQKLYGNLNNGLFSPPDFHDEACIRDYSNPTSVVHDRICGMGSDRGLPDLKDTIPGQNWVLDQRKQYIQALFDLGVRGFRIDAAKHMPTGAIRYFVPDEIANNAHVFAETITWGGTADQEYNLYLKPYLHDLPASFGAYDFPLLNEMKRAFSPGGRLSDIANPYATGNALEPRRAVTVAITHDIPYNTGFRSLIFDPKDEELAYAYLLARDGGVPMVFDDGSSWKSDGGRWAEAWKNGRLKRMIAFHNRMQGKWMEVLFADECALLWRREEDGIAGINKCGFDKNITVDTRRKFRWNRTYHDSLDSANTLEITGESFTFNLPGRTARLWFVE